MAQDKEITKSENILDFSDGKRPPLIRLEDGKVNVTTMKFSMSRKHRFVMFIDLWTIAWVSALTVYLSHQSFVEGWKWHVVVHGGMILTVVSVLKTVTDFANWLFTMNKMQEKMGDWYMDDVVGICQDFISAGVKFAAEEVKKVVGENTETESTNGEGEASNP